MSKILADVGLIFLKTELTGKVYAGAHAYSFKNGSGIIAQHIKIQYSFLCLKEKGYQKCRDLYSNEFYNYKTLDYVPVFVWQ